MADDTNQKHKQAKQGWAEDQASFIRIGQKKQRERQKQKEQQGQHEQRGQQEQPAKIIADATNHPAKWQLAQAIHALARHRPDISAHQPTPARILVCLLALFTGAVIGMAHYPAAGGAVILVLCFCFAVINGLGLFLWCKKSPAPRPLAPIADSQDLPDYAILLPLYREEKMVPQLVRNMAALDYPHSKLDILFLIEEKDIATRQAVMAELEKCPLPARLCIVPDGVPRTKPRACTYALAQIDSQFCVIYDAEDCPHPLQLREAAAHFAANVRDPQEQPYACFQAPLTIVKTGREGLAWQMQLEYAHLFGFLLPALARFEYPVPLGGTSNHLRTDILKQIHGWDAWNVTEDADLGVRLYEEGYLTGILSYPTQETATRGFYNHLCQRTRWQKGHLQTWLVRLRHPVKLWKTLGAASFIVFQLTFLGRSLSGFAHIYMLIYVATNMNHFPPHFDMLAAKLLFGIMLLSYALIILSHVTACVRQKQWRLLAYIPMLPILWLLTAAAALRAVGQILYQPSKWEKTEHGEGEAKEPTNAQGKEQKESEGQKGQKEGKESEGQERQAGQEKQAIAKKE